MFNNVNAKKRLTQVMVAFVIICMTLTGSFLLLDDSINTVQAAEEIKVTTEGQWNSAIDQISKAGGGEWTITLDADIAVAGGKLAAIPAGANVTLNMNGKNITWSSVATGNDDIITKSYPFANTYWGLITNNGTLNIQGTGTIKMQQVRYNYKNGSERDNYGAKVAAIVNGKNAYLNLGGSITIQSYLGQANTDGDGMQDMFLYAHGVYNEGTVDSRAKIDVGTFAGGTVDYGAFGGSKNSWLYAYSYGIFGGTVNVLGGSINSEAKSGFLDGASVEYSKGSNVANYAIGVYSNNAKIMGKTSITTNSISWRNKEDKNVWGDGTNMSWSVGVMYSKENYPVIGAGTDIASSFSLYNNTFVTLPGLSDGWTVSSAGGPKTAVRRGYAVAGIGADMNAAMYGGQSSETPAIGGNVFGTNSSGSWQDAASNYYYAEHPYHNSLKGSSYLTTSNNNVAQSGGNSHETLTSNVKNGAPGTSGAQYIVVYRYFDGSNLNMGNLKRVSYTPDTNFINDRAIMKVGGADNNTGVVTDASNLVAYSKGGTVKNTYFYEMAARNYQRVTPDKYVSRNINTLNDWKDGGILNDGGNAPEAGNVMVIYMDYVIKTPSAITIVAANKDTPITDATETTAFTVPYTGSALVPGSDFNLGILDNSNGYTNVVNDYNYKNEAGSSKTSVVYRYTSDNVTWYDGLPKDVGTYTIEVSVKADTTNYNRQAKQTKITGTITAAQVAIGGPDGANVINGTYGSTYGELFNNFKNFTLTNNGKALPATVTGTWSIRGVDLSATPKAGNSNLTVAWTPTDRNYGTAELNVTLIVAKREVTVTLGAASTTYGESTITSITPTYNTLPAIDRDKASTWLANTKFKVKSANGVESGFYAGLAAGNYTLMVDTFGGSSDSNYIFTFVDGTLAIEKRAIRYTAVATDKVYDGKLNVTVTLTNPINNYVADVFDSTINNVTGTMVNANAGTGKRVTVSVSDDLLGHHANNYRLVIDNEATLSVNVAKYTPTASDVSVVADITGGSIVYGEAKTIGEVGLTAVNTKIKGSWNWKSASSKPTVGQTTYVATFVPQDTTNYNSIEQNVNVVVEKATVEVTANPVTVTYGDSVPATPAVYNGFCFGESLENIDYEGNITISTDYKPGSSVRTEPYTISVKSDITAENYIFVVKNSTITVKAKDLTVTAKNATITYGADTPIFGADDVTATGLYGSDTLASISSSINVTTNYIPGSVTGKVGTYQINPAVVLKNSNYTVKAVAGTLTVEKAVLTVTPVLKTIYFGQDVPTYPVAGADYTITGFIGKFGDKLTNVAITGTPTFTTSYTNESYVNSYPVTAVTTGMSAANYTFEGAAGTIKVIKADPNVTTAPTATVVNSHPLADATFSNTAVVVNKDSGANVPGTFAFVNTSEVITWAGTNTTKVCEATFTPNDTYNYNTVKVNVTVKVTVKAISGIPVIQGSAMEGKTLSVSLASMDPNTASSYTYQWYVGNTVASTSSTYVVKTADIGKTIYVVLTAVEANGFTGNATSAATEKVIKALLETTAAQLKVTLPTGVVYDAMPHAGTVAIADGYNANYFGTPVLKYNGSDKAPTEAGTYVVTVDVSAPKEPSGGYTNNYYGPATGIEVGTITIARAPYTVTVLANDKVYDGNVTATATIVPSALVDESDIVNIAEGVTYSFDGAEAGTKAILVSNVVLTGEDAGNYEVVIEPTTATILPRVIYFRAKGVDKVFDGSNSVAVTFEYDTIENAKSNDWGYAPVDNAATIYLTNGTAVATNVNAGDGIPLSAINGDPAGASMDNYEVRISNANSATVNINRAPVTVVAPVINGETYDSTQPLSTFDLRAFETADGYWRFDDPTIVPTVKQKTYAATYYSKNDNYEKETPGIITINLERKLVILSADSKSVTYGANAPTYTITATGFTGTDSLAMIGGNITIDSTYAPGSDFDKVYDIVIKESLTRDNYTFETVNGVLTVNQRVINVTATAVEKIYDGNSNVTVKFSNLTTDAGVFVNDLGKVSLSYSSITGMAKSPNAGTTTVTYANPVLTSENGKAKNYRINVTPKSGELTVVIAKADVYGVEFPADATVEFGYDLTHVVFGEPGVGDGTFAYANASQVVPGALGTYTDYKVVFTPTDSKNYNTQEAVVSLQVIKCVLDYTVGIAGTPQAGQTLTVVATNLPVAALEYMTYQWYRVDADGNYTAIKGANEKSYVATEADVDYKLAVRTSVLEGSPFIYADGADTEVIEDVKGFVGETASAIKEVTLTFWQRLMDWLYRILAILTGIQLGGGLLGG